MVRLGPHIVTRVRAGLKATQCIVYIVEHATLFAAVVPVPPLDACQEVDGGFRVLTAGYDVVLRVSTAACSLSYRRGGGNFVGPFCL